MGRRPKVTREEVLGAARACFAMGGLTGTTLADIAARLGVSPAALLRHAATKEELFAVSMTPEAGQLRMPIDFLSEVDGTEDPAKVIRRIGEAFIPFLDERLGELVARWMAAKTIDEARRFPLPFDPDVKPTPPQRALALIESYLRRAIKAGRLRVSDPRAAALLLLGSCHAYVMLHRVVKIEEPPMPLDRYLDALIALWTKGAKPMTKQTGRKLPSKDEG
jgi:AcrR family transcriptional regulator